MAKLIGGPAHGHTYNPIATTIIVPCESRTMYNRWGQRLWSYEGETQIKTIPQKDYQFVTFWSAEYKKYTDGNYRFSPPMRRTAYLHAKGCPDCDEWRKELAKL